MVRAKKFFSAAVCIRLSASHKYMNRFMKLGHDASKWTQGKTRESQLRG